jgi:hypothetical protein
VSLFDLSDVVSQLGTGTYSVQRFGGTEYAGGRRGVPTASSTAWVPSVYQNYAPGSHVRNPAVNAAASFNCFAGGAAGTNAAWPFAAGHYQDGAVVRWDAIALNPADPLWVASVPSHYTVGQQRYNGAEVYDCITTGDAATSGGPTGRGEDIVDGTVHWKWVGPKLAAPFTIEASVQPLRGNEVDRLPEGLRTRELKKLYTSTELNGSAPGEEPDRVTIDGEVWEVATVERWAELGNYWKVMIAKLGR